MLPTGFRTFHFVSFLTFFFFSFLFLLFRFFSHYFVFVFLRFVFLRFFLLLFSLFSFRFFSFRFFSFLFVFFRFSVYRYPNFVRYLHDKHISFWDTIIILYTCVDHDPRSIPFYFVVILSNSVFKLFIALRYNSLPSWYTMMMLNIDHDPRTISIDFRIKKRWSISDFKFCSTVVTRYIISFSTHTQLIFHTWWPWTKVHLYWFWGQKVKVKFRHGVDHDQRFYLLILRSKFKVKLGLQTLYGFYITLFPFAKKRWCLTQVTVIRRGHLLDLGSNGQRSNSDLKLFTVPIRSLHFCWTYSASWYVGYFGHFCVQFGMYFTRCVERRNISFDYGSKSSQICWTWPEVKRSKVKAKFGKFEFVATRGIFMALVSLLKVNIK